jgi:hypothetical protein
MLGMDVLDSIVTDRSSVKPSDMEMIYYLFWEKGIDYNRFKELPIPYIFKILKSYNWIKKEEEKAHKKAMNK